MASQNLMTFTLLQGVYAVGLALLCDSKKTSAMLLGHDDDMSQAKLAVLVTLWLHRL